MAGAEATQGVVDRTTCGSAPDWWWVNSWAMRRAGKTRLGSSFFWEVLKRNPGRITVLCLIGIQTAIGESNGPNIKQRAAQRSPHHG